MGDALHRLLHGDQRAALVGILFAQQRLDRGRGEVGIRVKARPVFKGETLGFDLHMQRVRAHIAHAGEIIVFQDLKHLQGGDALALGRQFPDVIAAIIDADRLDPFRAVIGEILIADPAADALHIGVDGARDLTFVKRVAPALGDLLQGVRQIGIAENLALKRRVAVFGQIGGAGVVELLELVLREPVLEDGHVAVPVIGDGLGEGETLLRVMNGGGKDVGHRHFAKTLVQGEPAIHRARHGDRHGAERRNGAVFADNLHDLVIAQPHRRAAGAVQAIDLARLGVIDDDEDVPAYAVARGLHQSQSRVGGDGGVHRIAASFEHVQRDLCGQRVRGGGHAVRRGDGRTGGEMIAADPVAGMEVLRAC